MVLRVLYVASEATPLAKTGGLADVAAALPAALTELGIDVRLLLPAYRQAMAAVTGLKEVARLGNILDYGETRLLATHLPGCGIPLWLVDCPSLYDRSGSLYRDEHSEAWPDNMQRYALLSHVAAWLGAGLIDIPWRPDIIHCNDWHAGAVPALGMTQRGPQPRTVLTIHNLAYQGNFALEGFKLLGLDPNQFQNAFEFYGQMSFLKAGLVLADALTTVSPTYVTEILTPEFGCGLDGVLRERTAHLTGIMNGADYRIWDPAHDPHLPFTYTDKRLAAKDACKRVLQERLGLTAAPDAPILAFSSRLAHQKMPDVILEALPALLAAGAQFALVAEGDAEYEAAFADLAARYPGRVAVRIGYDEPLAHLLLAGSDALLHPSRYEPCGLAPIYAMRYGTLPIVRRTGGTIDSVTNAINRTIQDDTATGFTFEQTASSDLIACAHRALALYGHTQRWRQLQQCAMRQDFGWDRPSRVYADLYRGLLDLPRLSIRIEPAQSRAEPALCGHDFRTRVISAA